MNGEKEVFALYSLLVVWRRTTSKREAVFFSTEGKCRRWQEDDKKNTWKQDRTDYPTFLGELIISYLCLWNQQVYHPFRTSPPLNPNVRYVCPVHVLTNYVFNLHFNSIFHLLLHLQTGKFLLGLPNKIQSHSARYMFAHSIIFELILNLGRFTAYYYAFFFIALLLPVP